MTAPLLERTAIEDNATPDPALHMTPTPPMEAARNLIGMSNAAHIVLPTDERTALLHAYELLASIVARQQRQSNNGPDGGKDGGQDEREGDALEMELVA